MSTIVKSSWNLQHAPMNTTCNMEMEPKWVLNSRFCACDQGQELCTYFFCSDQTHSMFCSRANLDPERVKVPQLNPLPLLWTNSTRAARRVARTNGHGTRHHQKCMWKGRAKACQLFLQSGTYNAQQTSAQQQKQRSSSREIMSEKQDQAFQYEGNEASFKLLTGVCKRNKCQTVSIVLHISTFVICHQAPQITLRFKPCDSEKSDSSHTRHSLSCEFWIVTKTPSTRVRRWTQDATRLVFLPFGHFHWRFISAFIFSWTVAVSSQCQIDLHWNSLLQERSLAFRRKFKSPQ